MRRAAARGISGEDHSVATDNVRLFRLDVPYRGRLAVGRDDVLRNVEPDIGHAAVIDRALDVVGVARVDLDERVDLMQCLAV